MKLVLAGSYQEFKYYFPEPDRDVRYIYGYESLCGYHTAEIVRVGSWHTRNKELIMECDFMENRFNFIKEIK